MKTTDFESIKIWQSKEESSLLETITEPRMIESFEERDQTVIEQLIRKNLLTKVNGKHATFVYPTGI